MKVVNARDIPELEWWSPKRRFGGYGKQVSEALGRQRDSTDLVERHPFDVEIQRIPPGVASCPYHSHSARWEFYHVISGSGIVRHEAGETRVEAGDTFLFKPGEAHLLRNDGNADFVLFVVADNPFGESCYYPDSKKWAVESPDAIVRSESLDYYDGEE